MRSIYAYFCPPIAHARGDVAILPSKNLIHTASGEKSGAITRATSAESLLGDPNSLIKTPSFHRSQNRIILDFGSFRAPGKNGNCPW